MKIRFSLFCGLLVSLFVAVGVNAQTVEGAWQGMLKVNDAELRLRLYVGKDANGTLNATFDSIDQGVIGLPISAISLKDSALNFELEVAGATYEGKINADHTRISGAWTQVGVSTPLEFNRITVIRETKNKTPRPSDIDGDWEGAIDHLKFVLHIITYDDGMTASIDSPNQGAFGIPVTTITRDGAELKFEIKSIAGSYEGKLNPEKTTISGNLKQRDGSFPLVLKRKGAAPQPGNAVTEDLENIKRPDAKTLQSMPTVDQIFDRYVEAIGGVTANRKLTSRIMKMTLVVQDSDVTASIESYRQAPNKAVDISQIKLGNGIEFESSSGFNGAVGWSFNPADGGIRELSGSRLAEEKRDSEFYWEIKLKELYPKMALAGQATVGDRLAYCIEATPPEGDPIKLYFEAQTGLLVRLDSVEETETGGKIPIETYFEDYREVDGVKMPFTIRQPSYESTYKVNEVRHNVSIDEVKFNSPKSADLSSSLAAIEKAVELNRRNLKVPGAALVIVKDDRVVLLKGFGVRDAEKGLPVTPETLFGIGYCTKTFTAMAAVISADEGKLSLDDAPKKFLPDFKLRDPEADAKVTLRDLLSHRTGLNIMYVAAGEAIGKAQNSTWEKVVDSRIFKPLGMNNSNSSRRLTQQSADFSWGYDDEGNKWEAFLDRDASGAAGAINSSARDMGRWLRLLLGGGVIDGKRIVSEKGFQEMLTKLAEVDGSPYGLGLIEYNSKSSATRSYGHGGGIDGFAAKFVFVPAQKLGFAILTNSDDSGGSLLEATAINVLGRLLVQP